MFREPILPGLADVGRKIDVVPGQDQLIEPYVMANVYLRTFHENNLVQPKAVGSGAQIKR
jgi:hypothetical protein